MKKFILIAISFMFFTQSFSQIEEVEKNKIETFDYLKDIILKNSYYCDISYMPNAKDNEMTFFSWDNVNGRYYDCLVYFKNLDANTIKIKDIGGLTRIDINSKNNQIASFDYRTNKDNYGVLIKIKSSISTDDMSKLIKALKHIIKLCGGRAEKKDPF